MIIDFLKLSEEVRKKVLEEIAGFVNTDQAKIQINTIEFSVNEATFNLEEIERVTLIKALSAASGNISKTAVLLGITRRTVYAMIKKYSIDTFLNISDQ